MIKNNITKNLLCRLDHACFDYLSIVKLMQSTVREQKHFDLRSLLPALSNHRLFTSNI